MKTIPAPLSRMMFITLLLTSCTRHTIDSRHEVEMKPVEIKPIHITIDVNVKVDRALDDFFSDLDKASTTIEAEDSAK